VAPSSAQAVPGTHSLEHPDSFWEVILGSGYRATVDALSREQHDRLRGDVLREMLSRGVTTPRTDVVFGTAERPAQRASCSRSGSRQSPPASELTAGDVQAPAGLLAVSLQRAAVR
jgi:hypothetical protein